MTQLTQSYVGRYDGNATALEAYIAALMAQAARDSPLYRTYHPRHTPSASLMCAGNASQAGGPSQGTVSFADYVQQTSQGRVTLLQGSQLGSLPSYDHLDFTIGASRCLCGWPTDVDGFCQPPLAACAAIQAALAQNDCLFLPENESLVLAAFDAGWPCPEFDLSPHWGILDPQAAEQWLTGSINLTTPAEDVLRYGRSGLRAGGIDTLYTGYRQLLNPTQRQVSLDKARITTCDVPTQLEQQDDLAERLVDQLFPMAQGVEESGMLAHCLRYTIEVARKSALDLVDPASAQASAQADVVETWRRRCGAQMQLVHLCVNLDVYRAPDPTIKRFSRTCAYFAPVYTPSVYTTPECLVWIQGDFYDPCRCLDCNQNITLDPDFLQATPACRIRFDPRAFVKPTPIGWWDGTPPPDPSSLLWPDELAWEALASTDITGNTQAGEAWDTAEGAMAQNARDCDMIADWWPDDWDYPIGYHVTVPCDEEDTAYRSFHQAFGYSPGPTLVYQNDLFRDAGLVDTAFGAGGLCRTTSFGMPILGTNPMRYCTSGPTGNHQDYTVYGLEQTYENFTDWACSTSQSQLPWPDASQSPQGTVSDPSRFTIGLIPNMPFQGDTYYPATLDDMYAPGPWQDIQAERGWGQGCSDYPLYHCTIDYDCPSGYTCRGRFCSGSGVACGATQTCADGTGDCQGVCIDASIQCIRHSECAEGMACNGLGQCVVPVLSVQNKVDDDGFAFQVQANGACPASGANFSLLGASYWGYLTTDILRLHGMCSYGDW